MPTKRIIKPAQNEVAALKARAKKAANASREKVSITLNVPVAVYRALVELCEAQGQTIATVAGQALSDGVRKYRDFSDPTMPSPFISPTPLRKYPQLAKTSFPPNQSGLGSPQPVEMVSAAETQVILEALENLPKGVLFPTPLPLVAAKERDEHTDSGQPDAADYFPGDPDAGADVREAGG